MTQAIDRLIASQKTFTALQCKECGEQYDLGAKHVCEDVCFGPLEVAYDYEAIQRQVSREIIEAGPHSIWRYKAFLPVETDSPIDVGTGLTPLVKANRLARHLGLKSLYIKNDAVNMPTLSFKDRVVSVALTRAKELGFSTVSCASTGNLANSTAAIAAHAGLECCVFIPADLEAGKILGTLIYNPTLMAVKGNYDQVNRLCSEVANTHGWGFVNINLRPYYSEGSKTLGFEVAEQLGWQLPDHVVAPCASGSLFTKIYKGFNEFVKTGLVEDKAVRFSGAQAEGCSPISQAFKEGRDFITPVKPNTIAKSIAIGNPADGMYALDVARKTNGNIEDVTDAEIIAGMKLLAETEGIFTETAGGTTIAVLKKLVEAGKIDPDETTVAFITGNGLKTTEAVQGYIGEPLTIEPKLDSFERAWERANTLNRLEWQQPRYNLVLFLLPSKRLVNPKRDMAVKVLIPTPLQKFTNDEAAIECDGGNIGELMDTLESKFPGIKKRLCDEDGELRRFINFYVNSEDIRFLDNKETVLQDGDEVSIVPAVAGG